MATKYSGGKIKSKDALTHIAFNLQKEENDIAIAIAENVKDKAVAMVMAEKAAAIAENVKDKAVALVVAEKAAAIAEKDMERLRAFYLKKLSAISQRQVLNLFLSHYKFHSF